MRILDLFAGIGGFSLAGHWAGWHTVQFVEWDKKAQAVLRKNFPGVPIHGDITTYQAQENAADIICGGFPCQPFSNAGQRKGKADDRYLWPEMLRVITEVRPRWVVGENVAGLLSMDSGRVFEEICTSLEAEEYAVEAYVLPAISVGAPHRRNRVWIVARARHSECQRWQKYEGDDNKCNEKGRAAGGEFTPRNSITAHPHLPGLQGLFCGQQPIFQEKARTSERREFSGMAATTEQWERHWYEVAARLCRVDDGLPPWVDANRTTRLKQLGNAIVPQVAYEIFQAINEIENA